MQNEVNYLCFISFLVSVKSETKMQKLHKQLGKIYYIGILFGGLSDFT